MRRRSDLATLALAMAVMATPIAAAQPAAQASTSVLGAWRFDTARYDVGTDGRSCRMSGAMTIVRGAHAGEFDCSFVSTERCTWGAWSAAQTCTATRTGDKLEITSTIVRLTPANISYAPDNWSLTIRSTDLMVGELRSADIANVQFTRGPAYTS